MLYSYMFQWSAGIYTCHQIYSILYCYVGIEKDLIESLVGFSIFMNKSNSTTLFESKVV